MHANLLTPPRPVSLLQAWPRLAICTCGAEVLLARGEQGAPFKLEPVPLLPDGRCGRCRGSGQCSVPLELGRRTSRPRDRFDEPGCRVGDTCRRTVSCPFCRGTGRRGELFSAEHVLVSGHDGIARPFAGERGGWEAAHRRHQCAAAA